MFDLSGLPFQAYLSYTSRNRLTPWGLLNGTKVNCSGSGNLCLTVPLNEGVADNDSGDHLFAGSGDLCLTVSLTAGVADYDSGDHLCAGSGDPALRQDRWKIGNIFVI